MSKLLEKMFAHRGDCSRCHERRTVVMLRDQKTQALMPHACICVKCGQHYHMIIDDIEAWEVEQWRQKRESNQ